MTVIISFFSNYSVLAPEMGKHKFLYQGFLNANDSPAGSIIIRFLVLANNRVTPYLDVSWLLCSAGK